LEKKTTEAGGRAPHKGGGREKKGQSIPLFTKFRKRGKQDKQFKKTAEKPVGETKGKNKTRLGGGGKLKGKTIWERNIEGAGRPKSRKCSPEKRSRDESELNRNLEEGVTRKMGIPSLQKASAKGERYRRESDERKPLERKKGLSL